MAGEDDPEKWSHLLQMRGLKRGYVVESYLKEEVASFTDAWIETKSTL